MKRIPTLAALGLVMALLSGCNPGVVDLGAVQAADRTTEPGLGDPTGAPTTVPEPTDDADPPAEPADREDPPTAAPSAGQTDDAAPDTADTTPVRLYFLAPGGETRGRSGPFLVSVQREIASTPRIALATMRELVEGPTVHDEAMLRGISTAVPEQSLVLDVTINNGLATVDLSREFEAGGGSLSMFARLAQVVYTLTQFPTVDAVQFELDGQPVTVFSGEGIVLDQPVSRTAYLDLLPTIFVDSPAAGAAIDSDARITGMAAVFEATFQYRLEAADGTVLDEGIAMSDNGVGWGAFDFTITFDGDRSGSGTLTVWTHSAEDGSVVAERVTPVVLRQ